MTGAVSISAPAAIGARANNPRPLAGSLRISRQSLAIGRRLWPGRALRAATAAIGTLRRSAASGAFARPLADGVHRRARLRCGLRWRHLRRRRRGLLVGLLHARFEGFDALCEIAHDARQLAAPAKQQHGNADHQEPVYWTHRTHWTTP